MAIYNRTLSSLIEDAVKKCRLVRVLGPSKSGKTTIIRQVCSNGWNYIDLKDPEISGLASEDPDFFLAGTYSPAIFDGIERAPELGEAILRALKNSRDPEKRYILAGTCDPREDIYYGLEDTASFMLFPMSLRELAGTPDAVLPWEEGARMRSPFLHGEFLWENLLKGGMPEIIANKYIDPHEWFRDYIDSVINRELSRRRRKILSEPFSDFMKLLALKTGQPLNLSDMAREIGTTLHIARTWLDLLVLSNQVIILTPYSTGVKSQVIKTDKAYFTNTGSLCFLLGLRNVKEILNSKFKGIIFQTGVINEIYRSIKHRGLDNGIYFWKKATGMEVSIVIEGKEKLEILETSPTVKTDKAATKGLRFMKKELNEKIAHTFLVNPGKTTVPITEGVVSLPLSEL